MSSTGDVQQKAHDPSSKEPEKEPIRIPAWWSFVALFLAALVFLPIQYANLYSRKPVVQEEKGAKEAEKPTPATTEAPQSKPDVVKAEPAKSAPEPAVEAKAEKPARAATEVSQSQQDVAHAEQTTPAPAQAAEQKAASLPAPAEKQKVEDAIYYRIAGKDKQGREAAFSFIILTNGYAWAKGSSTAVLLAGNAIPDAGRLFAPKLRDSLARMTDVIAVGLATDEGKRVEEEARALARSKTFATWMKKVVKPAIPVWTLTLGQFEKACKTQKDKDLNFDQSVISIGVQSKGEGTNLQEALADAFGARADFPSRECYSRFDMLKIR